MMDHFFKGMVHISQMAILILTIPLISLGFENLAAVPFAMGCSAGGLFICGCVWMWAGYKPNTPTLHT